MKKNPFLTYGYAGAEYFCDREAETKKLIMHLTNGNNVVKYRFRPMGQIFTIK